MSLPCANSDGIPTSTGPNRSQKVTCSICMDIARTLRPHSSLWDLTTANCRRSVIPAIAIQCQMTKKSFTWHMQSTAKHCPDPPISVILLSALWSALFHQCFFGFRRSAFCLEEALFACPFLLGPNPLNCVTAIIAKLEVCMDMQFPYWMWVFSLLHDLLCVVVRAGGTWCSWNSDKEFAPVCPHCCPFVW